MLYSLVIRIGKDWNLIQAKLNRSAESCYDKYRKMTMVPLGGWKGPETEQLKQVMREFFSNQSFKGLVDPTADIKEIGKIVKAEGIRIPWAAISKRMGGKRSKWSCYKQWRKMAGLYSPSDMHRLGASTNDANTMEHYHPPQPSQIMEESVSTADLKSHQNGVSTDAATAGNAEGKISMSITEEGGDVDLYLLHELVALEASKASDICWEDLRVENAQERWYELLEEWQSSIVDDSQLALPISEIAQLILERKTSAQRAAETVEAVDLPNPLWNHD